MPEEINRVVTDRISQLLFCPSQTAVSNLIQEGISEGVHLLGDVMYDAVINFSGIASKQSSILQDLAIQAKKYYLATIHRAENTDTPDNIASILKALEKLDEIVILPLHPRTRKKLVDYGHSIDSISNIRFIEPLGYLDMLNLQQNSRLILTDSGGIQKEAYWLEVPCITLRRETEWIETVEAKANILVGADTEKILEAVSIFEGHFFKFVTSPIYGDGQASRKIVDVIERY
jgi:UDP-GlcNAc3NAcA epimerase